VLEVVVTVTNTVDVVVDGLTPKKAVQKLATGAERAGTANTAV
jgi:hypothetical protein